MSGLNICHKEDRVFLSYDSAAYDADGIVTGFVQKGFEIPQMRAFVACTGASIAALTLSRVLPDVYQDIDDVSESGESVLDAVYEKIADLLDD
ncbi:hypothetical protein U0C82_16080 [Fulvimarina sp. 2208YS6-2-32]|uniref:Uncharacterized protein n=1 Tax=Fulvimarina uroteuthidis TaxID=3098149 RepID=A0ABU5I5L8_9HYPH|nr:hypothetical protein [Fulvimarina sp. 2208YS6-2-32]MDY8110662.1 hypothetical protein [Fulvimarina sp. 2208YS6-2-32]